MKVTRLLPSHRTHSSIHHVYCPSVYAPDVLSRPCIYSVSAFYGRKRILSGPFSNSFACASDISNTLSRMGLLCYHDMRSYSGGTRIYRANKITLWSIWIYEFSTVRHIIRYRFAWHWKFYHWYNCNPHSYLVCLTIAPAFFGAAIYLCLARIIIIHEGENISRLKPRTETVIFVTCDVISLVLQAAGGAITSSAEDSAFRNEGVNIMIAGLAFQVAALGIFMAFGIDFLIRSNMRSVRPKANGVRKLPNPEFIAIRASGRWRLFLICESWHEKNRQDKYANNWYSQASLPLPSLFLFDLSSEFSSWTVGFTVVWLIMSLL